MKPLINTLSALLLASTMQAAVANVNAPIVCNLGSNCRVFTTSGINPASGAALDATAVFWSSANDFYVELINSALSDVTVPSDVLTGLFFTLRDASNASITLTPVSATLGLAGDTLLNPVNSSVFYDNTPAPNSQPTAGDVGGEYRYLSGISFGGANSGISAAGLGIFGNANFLNGPNGPPSPNLAGNANTALQGLDYGILSRSDNSLTGNSGVTGSGGLVWNAVQFHLTLPAPLVFAPGTLTRVGFQYGTDVLEPTLHVPLPGTLSLIILGFVAFWSSRRITRQQRQRLIAA